MYARNAIVINRTGLHARPASLFVACAKSYQARIKVRREGDSEDEAINAKSIVLLLSLGVGMGTEIVISAEGEDEVASVDALVDLIESGFGEL